MQQTPVRQDVGGDHDVVALLDESVSAQFAEVGRERSSAGCHASSPASLTTAGWQRRSLNTELVEAYRTNALFDAHKDDPEFGYRYLVDEARDAGEQMAERTARRICTDYKRWSVLGKKRGKNGKVGPPVHSDLAELDVTACGLNRSWLSDITEYRKDAGKLYPCAIKDVFSNRIVAHSIDSRMKSQLPTKALSSAVVRRGEIAG